MLEITQIPNKWAAKRNYIPICLAHYSFFGRRKYE